MSKTENLIISLGGSILVPNEIDINFLKQFKRFILQILPNYQRIIIVVGGGHTNKKYNLAVKELNKNYLNNDLDWLGIKITKINAELVRLAFGEIAHKNVIANPRNKIKSNKKVVIASGWRPGCSTDKNAVWWAKNIGAKLVANLTNINYVYDGDPAKNPKAKLLKEISWSDYRKIIPKDWTPRLNTPFDPIASRLAQRARLKVVILNGCNLKNFERFLQGKKFIGTLIH
ncbi:MAG: UMP kinase [Patescibacteria group bacterium]